MSAGVRGDISSIAKFSAALRELPKVIAHRVAERAAPIITEMAQATFNASETPYGVPWKPGHDGDKITLRRTGALSRFVRYVAIGTKLRVSLGVPYAKYQIGRRPVFPSQGKALPISYVRRLRELVAEVAREELGGSK